MGYVPFSDHGLEKYAWLPVRTTSKKWIWFKKYYTIVEYRNTETVRVAFNVTKLTKNEFLIFQLSDINRSRPPHITPTPMKSKRKPSY